MTTHKSFENIVKLIYQELDRKEHEHKVFENRELRKMTLLGLNPLKPSGYYMYHMI
jgi:hypothetical protein